MVLLRVQHLEDLALIGGGVGLDLGLGQGRPGLALARGVADQPGEVADEEDHLVAQVLEMLELVDEDRVPQVQVRRGGVKPGLDPERLAGGYRLLQALLALLLG